MRSPNDPSSESQAHEYSVMLLLQQKRHTQCKEPTFPKRQDEPMNAYAISNFKASFQQPDMPCSIRLTQS